MKSFIMSLLVFIVTGALVIANSIYIGDTSEKLLGKLEDLPDTEARFTEKESIRKKYDGLYDAWNDCKTVVGLSVNSKRLEDIEERLTELEVRIDEGGFSDYKNAKQHVKMLLRDLQTRERLSFDNIF